MKRSELFIYLHLSQHWRLENIINGLLIAEDIKIAKKIENTTHTENMRYYGLSKILSFDHYQIIEKVIIYYYDPSSNFVWRENMVPNKTS